MLMLIIHLRTLLASYGHGDPPIPRNLSDILEVHHMSLES